ncbi:helix-turn-helix domain-containing protein [Burkholderia stagnalis]|uniref:helix-turn-helix domain-containing protein n=1 Tax=Burkholderia stagnalis TaxID=1503054 RepID=UPI00075425A9|nr:helix-turn-helix transcriptional regulator [Burkholderia stagnalis]KVN60322.1 DNA-binding protein [Burkholderia stagnalis]
MDEQQKAVLVKAVGQTIASKRAAAGLSQERVAEALGITREAVSRMETGVAVPSVVRLAELAEIFGCGIEELLTDASNRKIDQARKIVDLLDGLPDDKRAALMSVIKQLVDGFLSH